MVCQTIPRPGVLLAAAEGTQAARAPDLVSIAATPYRTGYRCATGRASL